MLNQAATVARDSVQTWEVSFETIRRTSLSALEGWRRNPRGRGVGQGKLRVRLATRHTLWLPLASLADLPPCTRTCRKGPEAHPKSKAATPELGAGEGWGRHPTLEPDPTLPSPKGVGTVFHTWVLSSYPSGKGSQHPT